MTTKIIFHTVHAKNIQESLQVVSNKTYNALDVQLPSQIETGELEQASV